MVADPADYYETFYRSGAPRRVWDDLLTEFYHRPSYAAGQQPHDAVYYEGQRSVIFHILRRCEEHRESMTVGEQAEPIEGTYDPFAESEQVDVFAEPEDDGSMVG